VHPSAYHFLPFTLLFYLVLVVVFVVVVALIEIGVVSYAAERLGMERRLVFLLLLLCLLGSYVNIPVAQFPPEPVETGKIVTVYGVPYVIPVVKEWPGTVLAVNVGGALIPTGLAIYLMIKHRLYLASLVGIALVTLVVHLLARPVRGVGISVPTLLPPIAAALVALAISRKKSAPLAYISGTLGTLIGADLLNLGWLPGLGAPIASIGGAGTFDGVFLTGILAVLLA
jgi:uncharacterized membrane protein